MKARKRPLWSGFKSALADSIIAYLRAKRALGRKYETDERALRVFDQFLTDRGTKAVADVTGEVIDAFLVSRPRSQPRSYNALVGVVCRLFGWLVSQRLIARNPVRAQLRREVHGRQAYIFDARQAKRLLEIAGSLRDSGGAKLRGPTFHAIFALLYGLGLRVSEAANLTVGDLDLDRSVITVRAAKFGKVRLVPFGPKMAAMLRAFLKKRFAAEGVPRGSLPLFSLEPSGRAIDTNTIRNVFRDKIVPRLGIVVPRGTTVPRVHDLRHSFAVGTLLRWYRAGIRPADRLEWLSIFLGHVRPQSTTVYLTVTAELLAQANERFECFATPVLRSEVPS